MNPKWSCKFELKPGKWVFVPTQESIALGKKIKKTIECAWRPPYYYYHLQRGGHVAALRAHVSRSHFLRIDLRDFFGSINLTRVTRRLKERLGYDLAREWAKASTVPHPKQKRKMILPFGFVQSPIIASLCFAESALGKHLHQLSRRKDVSASLYMDDIIISTDDDALCASLTTSLKYLTKVSHFEPNISKQEGPGPNIAAFNIILAHDELALTDERMRMFRQALTEATSPQQQGGILAYVETVNSAQAAGLLSSMTRAKKG